VRLKDVLRHSLKTVRAYLLKESFQAFREYTRPGWARWFLKKWCARAVRSKLEPIKKFVGTLRRHEELLMNRFKAKKECSCGAVEGLNRKVNLITRKSYGFRPLEVLTTAPYHVMGRLPEPYMAHRF
jgi:transposase